MVASGLAVRRKTQPWRRILNFRPVVKSRSLSVGCTSTRDRLVAPHRCPDVVWSNAGDKVCESDAVLRLSDVVKTRIVHHRGRVAHLFDPFLIADLLLRIGRAGLHVVLEAERMADLVSNDVLNKLSHQVIRHREFLCTRIKRPDLREVPRTLKIHDVVIHLNVGFEDLAGTRIVDVRARGVLDGRWQPADDRVACVFRIEFRIFLL